MVAYNMIFAGFGGQGVLFSGKIAAYAALIDGREVSWLPSYGPEMRGGTANCSVCIDDKPIGSPMVTEPNVLVVLNAPSWDKFIDSVVPGGTVIYDSSLIERETKRTDIKVCPIAATELSNSEHLEGIANVIILGKVLKEVPFTTFETIKKAIEKNVPAKKAHLLEHNIRAIEVGLKA